MSNIFKTAVQCLDFQRKVCLFHFQILFKDIFLVIIIHTSVFFCFMPINQIESKHFNSLMFNHDLNQWSGKLKYLFLTFFFFFHIYMVFKILHNSMLTITHLNPDFQWNLTFTLLCWRFILMYERHNASKLNNFCSITCIYKWF